MPVERMKVPKQSDLARFKATFSMDIARASSIISSALRPESLSTAIAEAVEEFQARHGRQNLLVFLVLLAERLVERNAPVAADALRDHAQSLTNVPLSLRREVAEAAPPRAKRA